MTKIVSYCDKITREEAEAVALAHMIEVQVCEIAQDLKSLTINQLYRTMVEGEHHEAEKHCTSLLVGVGAESSAMYGRAIVKRLGMLCPTLQICEPARRLVAKVIKSLYAEVEELDSVLQPGKVLVCL